MGFWLDLFTPYTWSRFQHHGSTISGFRERQRKVAFERVNRGDLLICYLVGLSRWSGVLEVVSEAFEGSEPIFADQDDPFVIRFHVKPRIILNFQHALPIATPSIWSRLSITRDIRPGAFGWGQTAGLRQSLVSMHDGDANILIEALESQAKAPREYPLSRAEKRLIDKQTEEDAEPEIQGHQRLVQIAARLKGGESAARTTVRELLGWFGAERRGYRVVEWIKKSLGDAGLETQPDFEGEYIENTVSIVLAQPPKLDAKKPEPEKGTELPQIPADPTLRIGRLVPATFSLKWVKPNTSLAEAVTIMMQHDFSQLPVMTDERTLKGVISWTSIGSRYALGVKPAEVSECMDRAHVVAADASLFDALNDIVSNQYVLVQDATKKISAIVTTSDLSLQFRELAEPFLLLGEIENYLRTLIQRGNFSPAQLASCRGPGDNQREILDVSDMSLGECQRLMETPEMWSQADLKVDRKTFIRHLDDVRALRNDVMHFDPDPIVPEDLETLRKFARLLQKLSLMLPKRA